MSKVLLKIGFVKRLIFCLFSKVIWCNNEVKNLFMVIKKSIYKRVFVEEKMLTMNYPKRVTIFSANLLKVITSHNLW